MDIKNYVHIPSSQTSDMNLSTRAMVNHKSSNLNDLMTIAKCCLVAAINELVMNMNLVQNTVDNLSIEAGVKGDKGDVGPVGPKGDTGLPGKDGINGVNGIDGAKGDQGIPGIQGIQGEQGIQGNIGPQGIKGDTGPVGQTGSTGPIGPVGVQGPQGLQGPKGDTGLTGAAGDTNIKYAKRALVTNSVGVWTGTLPATNLALSITPRTEGALLSSIVENGTSITITFKRLNTGALGLTTGNLLTATILATNVGVVTFDLMASTIV